MKIKEGMIVKIRDDLDYNKDYGSGEARINFSEEMEKYRGMIKKVVKVGNRGVFNLEDCKTEYEDEMSGSLFGIFEVMMCRRQNLLPFYYAFTDEMVEIISDESATEDDITSEKIKVDTKSPEFIKQLTEDITGSKYQDFTDNDGVCFKVTMLKHPLGAKSDVQVVLSKQNSSANVLLLASVLRGVAEISEDILKKDEDKDELSESEKDLLKKMGFLLKPFKDKGIKGSESEIF